jgi:hypothetical protein
MTNIEIALKGWDKKSSDDIADIYELYCSDDLFTSKLISFLDNIDYQTACSWLLKHHFESKGEQSVDVSSKIYTKVVYLKDWQSRLLVLQSMSALPIDDKSVKSVEFFIRDCLADTNKFVRAWAYNGFYLLAKQHPKFVDEAIQFLNLGMTDEPSSVKVRIRKCLEQGF